MYRKAHRLLSLEVLEDRTDLSNLALGGVCLNPLLLPPGIVPAPTPTPLHPPGPCISTQLFPPQPI
jgi:hypothetical protein